MTGSGAKPRVLYVVYWGALEPLGRSLVVPSVLQLSKTGVEVQLITFEKPADLSDSIAVDKLRADLEAVGVKWQPLRYHKKPKWPATALDAMTAFATAFVLRRSRRFDVVHARTFVAGPMGYVIARLMGARFVFHNEGFYPDEQVDGGVWKAGSMAHRFAKRVEEFIYDHADGIITLSARARAQVEARTLVTSNETPVIVVSSAVDLQTFQPSATHPPKLEPISLVYLGSVGLRYRLDAAGRFVAAVRNLRPGSTLTVVSRAGRALVESMLDAGGLPRDAWSLKELSHADVPAELRKHDAGLFFLTEGLSEHGCSPTKIGEYWACGLPVVTTPNVSDTDEIVRSRQVGVIVRPKDEGSFDSAAQQLILLLADPALRQRCRLAAEAAYSLETACMRQKDLYAAIAP